MSNLHLRPCPFCGSEDVGTNFTIGKFQVSWWNIYCFECRATGPTELTKYIAVTSWNTRKLEDRLVQALEAEQQDNYRCGTCHKHECSH